MTAERGRDRGPGRGGGPVRGPGFIGDRSQQRQGRGRARVRAPVGAPVGAPVRDRGSATVWAVVVATVLVAVFGGVLLLGQAVVARHRAAAAADLSALAAAATWAHGPEAACATALRVAAAQGARVTGCVLSGEVVEVRVRAPTGRFAPELRSRAGPPLPREPG